MTLQKEANSSRGAAGLEVSVDAGPALCPGRCVPPTRRSSALPCSLDAQQKPAGGLALWEHRATPILVWSGVTQARRLSSLLILPHLCVLPSGTCGGHRGAHPRCPARSPAAAAVSARCSLLERVMCLDSCVVRGAEPSTPVEGRWSARPGRPAHSPAAAAAAVNAPPALLGVICARRAWLHLPQKLLNTAHLWRVAGLHVPDALPIRQLLLRPAPTPCWGPVGEFRAVACPVAQL